MLNKLIYYFNNIFVFLGLKFSKEKEERLRKLARNLHSSMRVSNRGALSKSVEATRQKQKN